jgi:hypothetical protein
MTPSVLSATRPRLERSRGRLLDGAEARPPGCVTTGPSLSSEGSPVGRGRYATLGRPSRGSGPSARAPVDEREIALAAGGGSCTKASPR